MKTPPSDKTICIAPDMTIPVDQFMHSATALIGKRGAGKSGGARVIIEELDRLQRSYVVLDPVGVYWGLRSTADGKGESGVQVVVIGGSHADIPLDRHSGAMIARGIIDANVSCVIDFSEEPKAVYRQFVRDFAHELYAKNDTPRIIIIEEAPELIPQRVFTTNLDTYEAVERLVSRGRNKNLGVVVISQRLATVNKDVLTQIDNLFVGRLIGKPDRKALSEWVEAWDVEDQLPALEKALATLPTRTMWLWSPETLKVFRQVRFRDFQTLHGDKTHLTRLGLLKVRPVTTDIAPTIARLSGELKRLADSKVAPEDVPRLRSQISTLQTEVQRLRAEATKQSVPSSAVDQHTIKTLHGELRVAVEGRKSAEQNATEQEAKNRLWEEWYRFVTAEMAKAPVQKGRKPKTTPKESSRTLPEAPQQARSEPSAASVIGYKAPESPSSDADEIVLGGGPARMLSALYSQHPNVLTRSQLAILVGIKVKGSTFSNYFSILKVNELIHPKGDWTVTLTEKGITTAQRMGAEKAPGTHEEVMSRWQRRLGGGPYKMLEYVVAHHPSPVTRQELADHLGINPTGSTASNYLSLLRTSKLVEVDGPEVKGAKILWPEG